jgi:outer membrane protein OmpA-like peptidoglycan-associated protein
MIMPMKLISGFIGVLVLALLVPTAAFAQEDAEGAKDHPVVPRLAGGQYYVSTYEARDFGAGDFYFKDDEHRVEGKFTKIEYWIKDNGKPFSGVEIGRNYQKAVAEKKGETLHFSIDNSGGSATYRVDLEGTRVWIGLSVSNGGEVYELTIVEETVMKQSVELNAGAMAAELTKSGRVTLRGILFDVGLATIRDTSAALLAEVAALLKAEPTLALEVVGHTDNTGTAAGNLTLSRQRAEAVKAWLVKNHAIDPARLSTSGRGDTVPVADNTTDAGRAENRRVELVKR